MLNEIIFELIKKAIQERRVKDLVVRTGLTRARLYAIAKDKNSNVTTKTAEKVLEAEKHPLFEYIKQYSKAA